MISQDSVLAKGFDNLQKAVDHAGSLGDDNSYRIANPAGLGGASVAGEGIPAIDLDQLLSKSMTQKIEVNWGEMSRYTVHVGSACRKVGLLLALISCRWAGAAVGSGCFVVCIAYFDAHEERS